MTTPPPPFALTDAILFTGEAFVEKQALLIENGQIRDIVSDGQVPEGFRVQSCGGGILAPAFIDCQVNGGGNVLLNASPTVEGALAIAAAHRMTGTTRLLPTCISDTPDVMKAAIEAVRAARLQDPSILGIHLEGPHLSEARKGTHNPAFVRAIANADMALYHAESNEPFLLTLAAEHVTPEQIKTLVGQGVIVAIGHSQADMSRLLAAHQAGASGVTHLFNGMAPMEGRNPGLAGFALDQKDTYASLIIDGAHVAQEMVRLAVRAKENVFMVSDAMPPAGADDPQPFMLCGLRVEAKDNVCINENGGLAGARLTLGECVPIAIRTMRLNPERVLRMASTIPAQFLGLCDRLGKLLPSYKADIVALDHNFKATAVWRDGVKVA